MSKLGTRAELSLAFSLYSGPGTYAILLGSGVSSADGVLTGWNLTLDLVRQLAALEGETADDPATWYAERYGREPSYSEVVNELAPTRTERRSLVSGLLDSGAAKWDSADTVDHNFDTLESMISRMSYF